VLGAGRAAALVADAAADTLHRLARIDAAIARGDDIATARGPAHELIGPSGIVGGGAAAAAARAMETAARTGDRDAFAAQSAILRGLIEAARPLGEAGSDGAGGGDAGMTGTPRAAGGAVP
jgi:hypothetical protein